MNAPLPTAILPLIQAQHVCFGHQVPTDRACKICLVQDLCVQHKDRLLAEFAQEWERFQRVGEDSDYISLSTPAPCVFCRKMMRPCRAWHLSRASSAAL